MTTDTDVLTISDALALGAVLDAAIAMGRVVRWVPGYGDMTATARNIVAAEGEDAALGAGRDVRDGFLRVTTLSGQDDYWPVRDLVREHQELTFMRVL